MNNECEMCERVDMVAYAHLVRDDLYSVLAKLEHMTDAAATTEAAQELRAACREGRLHGMTYGHAADGYYIACALGHLAHTADPERYERDAESALDYLVNFPHIGGDLENYVMHIPQGSTPEDNQKVANIVTWLDNYLAD